MVVGVPIEIKENENIELSNIWNFNNSYGCIWNLKKIELQN